MNMLMAATPLAMQVCGLPFESTALAIEWHVIGMFAPGFFTGHLIRRWGALTIMSAGMALNLACIAVALFGGGIAPVRRCAVPSSFASGALVTTQGWRWLNLGSLIPVRLTGAALLWLAAKRRRSGV